MNHLGVIQIIQSKSLLIYGSWNDEMEAQDPWIIAWSSIPWRKRFFLNLLTRNHYFMVQTLHKIVQTISGKLSEALKFNKWCPAKNNEAYRNSLSQNRLNSDWPLEIAPYHHENTNADVPCFGWFSKIQ